MRMTAKRKRELLPNAFAVQQSHRGFEDYLREQMADSAKATNEAYVKAELSSGSGRYGRSQGITKQSTETAAKVAAMIKSGSTWDETAEALGIKRNSFWGHVNRARKLGFLEKPQ